MQNWSLCGLLLLLRYDCLLHDDALLLEVRVELLVEVLGVWRRPSPGHSRHVRLGREVLALVKEQVGRGLVDLLAWDLLKMQTQT